MDRIGFWGQPLYSAFNPANSFKGINWFILKTWLQPGMLTFKIWVIKKKTYCFWIFSMFHSWTIEMHRILLRPCLPSSHFYSLLSLLTWNSEQKQAYYNTLVFVKPCLRCVFTLIKLLNRNTMLNVFGIHPLIPTFFFLYVYTIQFCKR